MFAMVANAPDWNARGREAYRRHAWREAHSLLVAADEADALDADDLELLATCAYMLGRDDEYVTALERAQHVHVDAGAPRKAARCAFWIGVNLAIRGETARATGWFGRAHRLLDGVPDDCVERGYLLIPDLFEQRARGDWEGVVATAAQAAEIGERFRDRDLLALAIHEQGHALVSQGRVDEGRRLLDEAMLAAVAGELSPIVAGLVYCSVIAYCEQLYELRRAREWTEALTQWCREQPEMVAHTGLCLVHRAEIIGRQGAWREALEEADRAVKRLAEAGSDRAGAGRALYAQGEIHRLRGEFAAAEQGYRQASRRGFEPQPGLALLRLAQGKPKPAAASIRRALSETREPLRRARLLPAQVEITLVLDDREGAAASCRELERIAALHRNDVLSAMAAQARGALELAVGRPEAGLVAFRHASEVWQALEAPYEAARVRVLIGRACRALGDEESARLELEAARIAFADLDARPDLEEVDSLLGRGRVVTHGLTARETEVLRLLAAGETNKAIADALVLSERTVHRHVSNIFRKLRVRSRSAATAYAHEHQLV